jgi:hypothetical protein
MSRVSTRFGRSTSTWSSSYSPPVSATSAPSGLSRRRRAGSSTQPAKRMALAGGSFAAAPASPEARRSTARMRASNSRGLNGLPR